MALNLLAQKFPGTGGAVARIVFAAPPGHTLLEPRYAGLLPPTLALARRVPQTVGVSGFPKTVMLSANHRIGFADLHFAVPVDQLSPATKAARQRVAGPARQAGLQVEFSGGVISTGSGEQSSGEIVGLIAAFIIVSRHRQQLSDGLDPQESVARAVRPRAARSRSPGPRW
jgi:RND superfamily putative drug exporter